MLKKEDEFDDDEDEMQEDWTDTSWAQPIGHPHVEGSNGITITKPNWNQHSDQLKSDIPPAGVTEDPSVVKRMLLNDNKAGMEGLDKQKINQIIHEASKGSRFYENEKKKEEDMKRRIEEQKQKIDLISEVQLKQGLAEADKLLEDFEQQRDLSRTIVHIDMDAFYAAAEMRDNPSLKNKPMAVGGTAMLSTSNYHARKFGVRAAMPGFIAKKLCPDLVIVSLNFDKYTAVSKQVKSLIAEYDPSFCPMSLDEAYLDITEHLKVRKDFSVEERTYICRNERFVDSEEYCLCDLNDVFRQSGDSSIAMNQDEPLTVGKFFLDETNQSGSADQLTMRPLCPLCGRQFPPFSHETFGLDDLDVVQELRTRIEQRTRLTASAGIAPNMMLSKVCSDKNKPNGQYKIPATREAVMNFICDLPTRKVSGIGKVSEAMMNAVGVFTCTDLYNKRALLYHLYSPISFNYFMRICLGIGSIKVERDSERKSISTERTFQEISKPADLFKKCEELTESLVEDLKEEQLKGKTVSIKIKTVNFEVKTRAHSLPNYTNDQVIIRQAAIDLLKTEIQACSPKPLRLRLMGVRMSNLGNQSICVGVKKQGTILGAFKKLAEKPKNFETDAKPSQTIEDVELENGDKNNNRETVNLVHLPVVQNAEDQRKKIGKTSMNSSSVLIMAHDEMKKANKSPVAAMVQNKGPPNSITQKKQGEENTIKEQKLNSVVEKLCEIPRATFKKATNDKSILTNQASKLHEVTNVTVNDIYVTPTSPKVEPEGRRNRSGLVRSNKKPARKRRASRTGKVTLYSCPICSREISCGSLNEFNEHVDECLEGNSNVSDSKGSDVCQIKDTDEVKHLKVIPKLYPVQEKAKLLPEGTNLIEDIPELHLVREHVELVPEGKGLKEISKLLIVQEPAKLLSEVTSPMDITTLAVQKRAQLLQGATNVKEMDFVSDFVSSTDKKFKEYETERSKKCDTNKSKECETVKSKECETERSKECDTELSKECDTELSKECDTELSKECDTENEPCHMKPRNDSVLLDSDHELNCDTEICSENSESEEIDKTVCDKDSAECTILTYKMSSFTSLHGDIDACRTTHNDTYHGIERRNICTDNGLKVVPYENNSENNNKVIDELVNTRSVMGNQQNRKPSLENEEVDPNIVSLSEKEGTEQKEKSISEIIVYSQSKELLSESEIKSLSLKEGDVTLEKPHNAPPLPVLLENCEFDSNHENENTKNSFLKTSNELFLVDQQSKNSNVRRVTVCKGDQNDPLDFRTGEYNETKDMNSSHDTFAQNSYIHDQPSKISKTTSEDQSRVKELPLDNRQPTAGCSWMADDGNVPHDNVATTTADNDYGVTSTSDAEVGLLVCPVCNVEQRSVDLNAFNSHVDSCLSRGAISEILKEQRQINSKTLKREREVVKTPVSGQAAKKRRTILPNKSPSCKSILSFFKDPQSF